LATGVRILGGFIDRLGISVLRDLGGDSDIAMPDRQTVMLHDTCDEQSSGSHERSKGLATSVRIFGSFIGAVFAHRGPNLPATGSQLVNESDLLDAAHGAEAAPYDEGQQTPFGLALSSEYVSFAGYPTDELGY
jgi:hypothetical protein